MSDFDRTLYVDGCVSEKNRKAVKDWQERENLFVIASGRDYPGLREKLEEQHIFPDYFICNNGGMALDKTGTILWRNILDEKAAKEVVSYLYDRYGGEVCVSCPDRKQVVLKGAPMPPGLLQIHKRFDLERQAGQLAKELNEKFADKPIWAFSNVHNVDIVPKGTDKAQAVGYLAEWCEIKEQPAVIGDSFNDIGMIKKYKGSTLVHASELVKQAADTIYDDVAACLAARMFL